MTTLLERTASIGILESLLKGAMAGTGSLALVSGEAGIGKAALLRSFLAAHNPVQAVFGYCGATEAARTLGPIEDLALQLPGSLRQRLSSSTKSWHLFEALVDDLASQPTVRMICIEDIHWADQATLDFLRLLARRCAQLKLLMLLTLREFEPESARARSSIQSTLPIDHQHEIQLERLSQAAVEAMARDVGHDPSGMYDLTRGNPLFLASALRWRKGPTPDTLLQLARQRLLSLPPDAQRLVRALAIHPDRIDRKLLQALPEYNDAALAVCRTQIWLVEQNGYWVFEHEMIRLAVLADLSAQERTFLHAEMLKRPLTLAQQVHHALHAQAFDVLGEAAPTAARAAFAANSYREAVNYWHLALEHTSPTSTLRAEWLDSYAWALVQSGEPDRAFECCRQARQFWLESGDADAILRNMSSTLRMAFLLRATSHWFSNTRCSPHSPSKSGSAQVLIARSCCSIWPRAAPKKAISSLLGSC